MAESKSASRDNGFNADSDFLAVFTLRRIKGLGKLSE